MQNCRLHAFVPADLAHQKEQEINVGKIYIISNFTVKEYKPYERIRCIRSDEQIFFTSYTNVEEVNENETLIQENDFDFFDLADLEEVGKHNVYLTGILSYICTNF